MYDVILKVAFRELRAAWTRSLLTMLGVVIGVASVVAMVSLGEGAKRDILQNIRDLGANLLIVRPGRQQKGHARHEVVRTLTTADAEIIRRRVPHVVAVAPTISRGGQLKHLNRNAFSTIVGVTPDFLHVRSYDIARGAFIAHRDLAGARRVVVLGQKVATDLFGGRDPIGEYVKVDGVNFEVIGVMVEKGDMGWFNADDQLFIPVTTFQKRVFGQSHVQEISVQVDGEEWMPQVSEEIARLLRRTHRIGVDKEDDFHVLSQVEIMRSMEQVTRTFTFLLGGIAALSHLVGGIGIMNIMLVTVTERTREIGLRKALGARKRDIMKQFLTEATVLSGIGGIIGVGLGALAAWGISDLSQWGTYVSPASVVLAYSVALGVGIFFGWYPALKAARLNPVDALRRE